MSKPTNTSRLRSSSSVRLQELVKAEVTRLDIGEISVEATQELVQELDDAREVIEEGPSLISLLVGDFLTFVIFTAIAYLIIIQIMNGLTGSILN